MGGFRRDGYDFRPARADDMPMLRRWLETAEVVRWWGDPAYEAALLEADLAEDGMTMLVVSHDGRPFAYAQHYDLRTWPQPHFRDFPPGTRAIDCFIGDPAKLGRGHGSAFLRHLAHHLIDQGAPLVVIDPDPENERARRAYGRAGFHELGLAETGEGPAMVMVFRG